MGEFWKTNLEKSFFGQLAHSQTTPTQWHYTLCSNYTTLTSSTKRITTQNQPHLHKQRRHDFFVDHRKKWNNFFVPAQSFARSLAATHCGICGEPAKRRANETVGFICHLSLFLILVWRFFLEALETICFWSYPNDDEWRWWQPVAKDVMWASWFIDLWNNRRDGSFIENARKEQTPFTGPVIGRAPKPYYN